MGSATRWRRERGEMSSGEKASKQGRFMRGIETYLNVLEGVDEGYRRPLHG
jgi:hypothetical protein